MSRDMQANADGPTGGGPTGGGWIDGGPNGGGLTSGGLTCGSPGGHQTCGPNGGGLRGEGPDRERPPARGKRALAAALSGQRAALGYEESGR